MFTEISWNTLQNILLGCTPSWGILACVFTDLFFHFFHPC